MVWTRLSDMHKDVCRGAVRSLCPVCSYPVRLFRPVRLSGRAVKTAAVWGLALFVTLWANALLAEDAEDPEDREKLTISVGDWPPFFDEDEVGQGSVARLVRDIFAEQGYDVTFQFLPWKRAYREAATGQHSATAIWMHAEDREKDFIYSDAVMQEQFVLFHRADEEIQWAITSCAGRTSPRTLNRSPITPGPFWKTRAFCCFPAMILTPRNCGSPSTRV